MFFKFPSGRGSVSVQDLHRNQQNQLTCGICDKPWVIDSDGCIKSQLHVFHPCQHLIGSGCWISVPADLRDKCPVCKVEIRYDEKVRVVKTFVHSVPASQDMHTKKSKPRSEEALKARQAQDDLVWQKMQEGLNDVDVRAIMYYMNLRARLSSVKGCLSMLLARTETLTPTHRDRLVIYLADTAQDDQNNDERKVEVALSAFNISRGTGFRMDDLRETLFSAEAWIKRHFAAILQDNEAETSTIRRLEKTLADVAAELTKLKHRQYRESAQRLKDEIKLVIADIAKKTEEEVVQLRIKAEAEVEEIRAEAEEKVAEVHATTEEDAVKIRARANEEITKLQSLMKAREK